MSPLVIRPGTREDLPVLTAVYNHHVVHGVATFDTEPFTVEQRERDWFGHYAETGRHRLLVAELGGRVVGYATSGAFRTKPAYAATVETTVYLAPDATGQGVGRALYAELLTVVADEGAHLAVAAVAEPNAASTALHTSFGFRATGTFHEVGFKHGRWVDVTWYQLPLDASRTTSG